MNPYESSAPVADHPLGPIAKGFNLFFALGRFLIKFVLLLVGFALAAAAYTVGLLNCGLECFGVGLFIWLIWNQCLVLAFSPYLIAPISYLTAVGIFVLFKIFFGGANKPTDNSPKMETTLSDEHRRLIQTYERTKATLSGAARAGGSPRYTPGSRQAYNPAYEGQSPNSPGGGNGDGGRKEGAPAGA